MRDALTVTVIVLKICYFFFFLKDDTFLMKIELDQNELCDPL